MRKGWVAYAVLGVAVVAALVVGYILVRINDTARFPFSDRHILPITSAGGDTTTEVEWLPVKDVDLNLVAGSALDFSALPGIQALDTSKALLVQNGQWLTADGSEPARLHCASLALSPIAGSYPKAGAAAANYAHQLKMHGYNIARFHYVDATLMTRRLQDFDYDPVQKDNWHSLLAALKKEGIYWLMDAMTSENGAIGNVQPHRWVKMHDLKLRVYYDPVAQQHWRDLVRTLLTEVNPYTGIAPIEDPALVGIITVNEGGLNYLATLRGSWPPALQPGFNDWLHKHYASREALAAAWPDLASDEALDNNTVRMPATLREVSPRMADFQRYLSDLEIKTNDWMTAYLRSLNYAGMISAHDNWLSSQADAVRGHLSWVDLHNYQDLSLSYEPGTKIEQSSSINNFGRYLTYMAAGRQANKLFSVTEYGQPFWNRYRFESGLLPPTLARFQGWGFACQHAEGAIDPSYQQPYPRKQALFPYGIGLDPVTRAGETLAALIMARGDVSPSPNLVLYDQTSAHAMSGAGVAVAGKDVTSLAWMTGLATATAKATIPDQALAFAPNGATNASGLTQLVSTITNSADSRLQRNSTLLRQQGILDGSNKTEVDAGVIQGDTGEFVLDQPNGQFHLTTARTEALAANRPVSAVVLSRLTVNQVSAPALVAASALDGQPLASSKRILLILASDAQNTGMQFADAERRELANLGTLPVQILRTRADLSLQVANGKAFHLYSLHLNGSKGDTLPLQASDTALTFTLDNGALSHGPTTFFLLEATE